MNVFFHVTTAVGVIAIVSDTCKIDRLKDAVLPSACALILGVIIHGVLDYLPHTYPFPAKVDVLLALIVIAFIFLRGNRKYWLIFGMAFLGCVLPDLIDLLPAILNTNLNLGLPENDKIFPFHQKIYSGSIFEGTSIVSDLNHVAVLILTSIVVWCRRRDFLNLFIDK